MRLAIKMKYTNGLRIVILLLYYIYSTTIDCSIERYIVNGKKPFSFKSKNNNLHVFSFMITLKKKIALSMMETW